jgi:2-polyprenyl-6-methoxyphenol hydroxylase-like FAD-dependent oxidoreductase
MLAGELCLAGVRPLVLERQPRLQETARANGFVGQIVELLRYRGLLDRFEAAGMGPIPTPPRLPFGGLHVDFSPLAELPVRGLRLPQQRLEHLLEEHARELGTEVRRGQEVVGVSQDDLTATAEVCCPDGLRRGYGLRRRQRQQGP